MLCRHNTECGGTGSPALQSQLSGECHAFSLAFDLPPDEQAQNSVFNLKSATGRASSIP